MTHRMKNRTRMTPTKRQERLTNRRSLTGGQTVLRIRNQYIRLRG